MLLAVIICFKNTIRHIRKSYRKLWFPFVFFKTMYNSFLHLIKMKLFNNKITSQHKYILSLFQDNSNSLFIFIYHYNLSLFCLSSVSALRIDLIWPFKNSLIFFNAYLFSASVINPGVN